MMRAATAAQGVIIRGANVMQGYYKDGRHRCVIKDGWLHRIWTDG